MTTVFVRGPGFIGTRAPLYADLSLILILLTAVLFTIGWRLAVGRHFGAHRWIQTVAVILNTVVVLGVMIASFIIYILPGIPSKLLQGTYGITTVHALVGLPALFLGVFVVLRGHERVPRQLRFENYKLFMRTSYALYMLSTLIGVIAYLAVYVGLA
jgi:uncharacterized membrane protein YozB (DUF420 family)